MNTSNNQSSMRKLPEHSRVRRRLFPDPSDEANIDNFANILQENSKIDRDNMKKKYNFDFEEDLPLEGPYEWSRKDGDNWIGMKVSKSKEVKGTEVSIEGVESLDSTEEVMGTDAEDTKIDDFEADFGNKFVPICVENEITPKYSKDDSVPVIRKRRREDASCTEKGARRKISFD